ncbi:MAG TPA: 4-(cytidine 5'-diphospho)-2-C-methyl-D-erythritol kinase [Candidatus Acidoferrum sp.]|nr:4-(cytidine 5'-diphospho)-2-C-methyl-D-erythritol kinase [Candidatus Acidoferrum sp.]
MPEVRIPSFAKINLRLDIVGKRADNYHELRTIFQTISLHDDLHLRSSRKPEISLTIHNNARLASEPLEKNLVYRAIDALRRELKIKSGVEIDLRKKIPAGGGLGGGSSNAAAALLGYLQLTRKQIPLERLIEIATPLGADVPFFLFGGRALGVNKGDEIYPLADVKKHAILVVAPQGIHVPTPDAFRWVNAPPLASSQKPQLTKPRSNSKLSKFCALCWSAQLAGLSNDFEAAVFRRHPRLATIKRELLRAGAAEAMLAGSGSAVFAVFPSPALARRAAVGFSSDQTFVCETISRDRYKRLVKTAF